MQLPAVRSIVWLGLSRVAADGNYAIRGHWICDSPSPVALLQTDICKDVSHLLFASANDN